MHHNDVEYWRYLQSLPPKHPDLPSPRVCRLLLHLFERWQEKPRWLTAKQTGHLFRDRPDLSDAEQQRIAQLPLPIRKGMAIARMLELITERSIALSAGSCTLQADELIIGTLPPFSVGQGKEFVGYLTPEEELEAALNYLSERSVMGHIVPDYAALLNQGITGLIQECQRLAANASQEQRDFYQSVTIALEGVVRYAERYATLAEAKAQPLAASDPNRENLRQIAERLRHAPSSPPRTFHEACQAIYILHCAFHWTVEIVPFGRLDQLLIPFYTRDCAAGILTREQAQEIIDCFWIKLDESVILKHRHAEDRFTATDGTLTGTFGPSNFDQGGLLNQWMQQITIGGVVADDDPEPKDATNDLTYLFLEAARRLPLNSPTLDLRVHSQTPRPLLEAAAHTLLSGGAHPVLLNDDVIIPALADGSNGHVPLRSLRNYACDGCFETHFAGETEFSFGFVPALDALEKALNRGAGLAAAGPMHLRGFKESRRTPHVSEIETFEQLWAIQREHILMGCHRYLHNLLTFYGNRAAVAPSPLLSAFIGGCLETGRDLAAGGARYHLFSPLMVGISNAVDSLYVLQTLVFDQQRFTLEELVTCLATNWGQNPEAPGRYVPPERVQEIRRLCLAAPKFGQGCEAVDKIAWRLINEFADCVQEVRQHPVHRPGFERLKRYDAPGRPFEILLAPGVGTFEQYVFSGSMAGASADGRAAGAPIASDLSPAPIPPDLPAIVETADGWQHARRFSLRDGLKSYADACMKRIGDGGPVDYNIPEDFPPAALADVIALFAQEGGSICTFTVADAETFREAALDPEKYNLVRVRMGGWSEFFITLFPEHQEQHRRRPLYLHTEATA